jgi:hypothetical protein
MHACVPHRAPTATRIGHRIGPRGVRRPAATLRRVCFRLAFALVQLDQYKRESMYATGFVRL